MEHFSKRGATVKGAWVDFQNAFFQQLSVGLVTELEREITRSLADLQLTHE